MQIPVSEKIWFWLFVGYRIIATTLRDEE